MGGYTVYQNQGSQASPAKRPHHLGRQRSTPIRLYHVQKVSR
ncbi:hypothetical protein CABS03_11523 [Colletotrichum abscissum]|uniref:Uncharacterized protein n=1 Tax=Colletotrichum abscissum TaxID=1671311 RepID=A0A9Q0AY92_9PEZI|nr:hypothetical protein CABS02_11978 [Colletotrichum abscissum]